VDSKDVSFAPVSPRTKKRNEGRRFQEEKRGERGEVVLSTVIKDADVPM